MEMATSQETEEKSSEKSETKHVEEEKEQEVNVRFSAEVKDIFGETIAHAVLPKDKVLVRKETNILGERYVHPQIKKLYTKISKNDLTVDQWVQILQLVLECKYVEQRKLGQVFSQVYSTLTGKRLQETTFDKIVSAQDKELWINNYTSKGETPDPTTQAYCKQIEEVFKSWCIDNNLLQDETETKKIDKELEDKADTDGDLSKKGEDPRIDYPGLSEQTEISAPAESLFPRPNWRSVVPQGFGFGPPPSYFNQQPPISRRMDDRTMPHFQETSFSGPTPQERLPDVTYSIRIIDFLPEPFNPSGKNNDPESHLLGFQDYLCAQLKCDDLENVQIPSDYLSRFRYTLRGQARIWHSQAQPFASLKELETAFLKEFGKNLQSRETAARAMAELSFKKGDKLSLFINKLMALNKFLCYDSSVLADRFLAAMPTDVRRLIKISDPKDFNETLEIAKQILVEDGDPEPSLTIQEEPKGEATGAMIDMMYSVQSLKSEIDKISGTVNDRLSNIERQGNAFSRGRGQFYGRNFSQRGRNVYRGRPNYGGNNFQNRMNQNGSRQQWRGNSTFRGRGQYRPRQQNFQGRDQLNGPRCYLCSGFNHMKFECPSANRSQRRQINGRPLNSNSNPNTNQSFP